jgi:radical SAM superfamily enzyme YgiQ (UPF0313 family)
MRLHLLSDEERNNERPKLGLGYLASYLQKYAPWVSLSISFEGDNYLADIKMIKPDVVGLSAMTPTFANQIKKAKKIKEKLALPMVIGGNHISLVPKDLPQWLDVGVISEGEEVLLRLLKHFEKTGILKDKKIPALVFWDKGKLKITGEALLIEPIDKIPSPDWDFLEVGKNGPGHIMTSRGCPFHCRFCEAGRFWKKYRCHSPEYVAREVETIHKKYGREELVIMDDLFFLDRERAAKIADIFIKKGLARKMRFEIIGRADLFDEEMAKILKRMGTFAISFGMESGSEPILQYLKNKTVTVEQIRRAVSLAKKYQLEVLGGFMVGTPGEEEADIRKTIEFIKELDLDQVGINVTTPLPGTELWEEAKRKKIIKDDYWDDRLWGMKDVTDENIDRKLLLTDIPKRNFLKLLKELDSLQDFTHRRRRNEQLFRQLVNGPDFLRLAMFLLHTLKRPKEACYNLTRGYFKRWLKLDD